MTELQHRQNASHAALDQSTAPSAWRIPGQSHYRAAPYRYLTRARRVARLLCAGNLSIAATTDRCVRLLVSRTPHSGAVPGWVPLPPRGARISLHFAPPFLFPTPSY